MSIEILWTAQLLILVSVYWGNRVGDAGGMWKTKMMDSQESSFISSAGLSGTLYRLQPYSRFRRKKRACYDLMENFWTWTWRYIYHRPNFQTHVTEQTILKTYMKLKVLFGVTTFQDCAYFLHEHVAFSASGRNFIQITNSFYRRSESFVVKNMDIWKLFMKQINFFLL
jgi:hypothetical protein